MKNTTTIKTLIGLSQEEMAMLLGITRTQWSMFEIGRRDIPLAAKQQLAALLSHTQQTKSVSKDSIAIAEAEKKKEKEWLQLEYKALHHKQQFLERKIRIMENCRTECFAALETAHFLESQLQNEFITSLAKSIQLRVKNTLTKNSLHRLQEMQFKKESFEVLKSNVTEKLK